MGSSSRALAKREAVMGRASDDIFAWECNK